MPKKVKQVKDKEGVIFTILLDPKISKKKRNRPSTQYVKSLIENKLKSRNVYPINNIVGFPGDIDNISYFISGIILSYLDSYSIENQVDTIYNI
jgi:hypothetical protein